MHDHIGLGDLGLVRARVAGLLVWLPAGGTTFGPRWRGGIFCAICSYVSTMRAHDADISVACGATSDASCSHIGGSEEESRVGIPHRTRVGRAVGGRGSEGT